MLFMEVRFKKINTDRKENTGNKSSTYNEYTVKTEISNYNSADNSI